MVPGSTLMYGSNFWRVTVYPWPSSKQPMDAAANPLPSEETTPPVTKMYLVARSSLWVVDGVIGFLSRRRCRQEAPDVLQILGRVDSDRVVGRFDGLDSNTVLECAKLLEGLGALERSWLQSGQDEQSTTAIRVQADMTVERGPSPVFTHVRNGCAREIQRESRTIENDLHDVRIPEFVEVGNAAIQGRHLQARIGREWTDGFADGARIDKRFVALHVDDHIAIKRRHDLGKSIHAARMIRTRQAYFAAEPGDCRCYA